MQLKAAMIAQNNVLRMNSRASSNYVNDADMLYDPESIMSLSLQKHWVESDEEIVP